MEKLIDVFCHAIRITNPLRSRLRSELLAAAFR